MIIKTGYCAIRLHKKTQERFKSAHNVYTGNTNKIALSINLANINLAKIASFW